MSVPPEQANERTSEMPETIDLNQAAWCMDLRAAPQGSGIRVSHYMPGRMVDVGHSDNEGGHQARKRWPFVEREVPSRAQRDCIDRSTDQTITDLQTQSK
jgi:hypothetical protein